ncbi:carbonic anhydrase [Piscinibacter sakaiensis]|uniref:carbonic anhydrase n=1 Tax=Piscinibacter sakaiensis TaxID=1547922 RepID=A0A0K8P3E9_PISS1|nr:carbonic anhydrase family protein [Piscinibacter sakaiensis]GAP37089.1 carbonic anhydrase [Piscinibacter sakaiensis]
MRPVRRPFALVPFAAAFPLACAAVLAAAGPSAARAEDAAPSRAAAAADPAVALPPGKDPLDHLRERLADRLGGEAKPRPNRAAPATVKVTNKAEPEPAAAPRPSRPLAVAAARAGVAGESPVEQAAALAARHREGGVPAAGAAAAHGGELHWAYQGDGGPQAWGRLKPEFETCASGRRQSPIDIRDGFRLQLEPVAFDYRPSAVRVIDNGHTVQVNVASGNVIEVGGRRYELQQFHFHRPSEERVDGRQYDMNVHLVHKDAEGRLAVVAVLLARGAAQPLIQTVWNNLPLEKGEEQRVRDPLDLTALLPVDRRYFTYMGSLTTPPCTEGVLWMVMKTPVEVSDEQIGIFSRLYPMNARPVQAASGRMIKESP